MIKKSKIFVLTMVLPTMFLVGCQQKSQSKSSSSENTQVKHTKDKYDEIITTAKKAGKEQDQKLAKVKKIKYKTNDDFVTSPGATLKEMTDRSTAIIQGVVTKWTSVPKVKNTAITVLSVYVNKTLSDKSKNLVGKTIYVYQQGGYNTRRNFSDGMEEKQDSKHLTSTELNEVVFYQKEGLPVPKPGTEVVLDLKKNTQTSLPDAAKVVDINNSYSLSWEDKGMWIKSPTENKYQTAGEVYDVANNIQSHDENRDQITKEINNLVKL